MSSRWVWFFSCLSPYILDLRASGDLSNSVCAKSLQLCPTLWDPMDCSPPGFSVPGILQPRILEWVAMSSFRGSSQPRIKTASLLSSALAGRFFTTEPPEILQSNSFKRHLLSTFYERSSSLLVLTSLWTQAKLKGLKMKRQLEKRLRQENDTFID